MCVCACVRVCVMCVCVFVHVCVCVCVANYICFSAYSVQSQAFDLFEPAII